MSLETLLQDVRACTVCAAHLPLEPRPVVRAHESARLVVTGQAPGTKVHATGIPWNDASGQRLRDWMGITRDVFYDERQVASIPMGFCYPGKGKSGDLPPRPECAPLWHERLRTELPNAKLTLLIGQYAQVYYLREGRKATLTETVQAWQDYFPSGYLPIVHPSPRNDIWLRKNPWFEKELVPELRRICKEVLT